MTTDPAVTTTTAASTTDPVIDEESETTPVSAFHNITLERLLLLMQSQNKPLQNNEMMLESNDLQGIANFIKSGKCKNISILIGAGISVSAGIPDFRSKNGFYNTLDLSQFKTLTDKQRVWLTREPESILSIQLFKENPSVYIQCRAPFILAGNKYKATLTHWFLRLLYEKGLLKRLYSTNIDGLDLQIDVPSDVLVHVHGTTGKAACFACKAPADMNIFRKQLQEKVYEKQFIRCQKCSNNENWIKPCTTLFGESMPQTFWDLQNPSEWKDVHLFIVAGTSLKVSPSCSLPDKCGRKCVRLLVNRERCGNFNFMGDDGIENSNDVFFKGDTDDGFMQLAQLLGWEKELNDLCGNKSKSNTNCALEKGKC